MRIEEIRQLEGKFQVETAGLSPAECPSPKSWLTRFLDWLLGESKHRQGFTVDVDAGSLGELLEAQRHIARSRGYHGPGTLYIGFADMRKVSGSRDTLLQGHLVTFQDTPVVVVPWLTVPVFIPDSIRL